MNTTNWKKDIILFLTSQTISLFGSSLVQYAIMWYITLKTQSGVMMMLSIICGFLPTFFLSPFGGVWADRYNRKMLIVVSDSLIAASTLVLAILFFMGFDALWLLFVASAIRSLGTAVQTPAVSALIPQLVPEEQLTRVNGANASVQAAIMLLSPIVSGALLAVASIQMVLLVDVVTAVVGVLTMVIFLRVPSHAKALGPADTTYFSDMMLGWNYIKNHGFIKKFFLFFGIFTFLAAPVAFLTPLQVTRSFGGDVWRLTAIEITFSVGMMLGGALMSAWSGFHNRIHTMVLSAVVIGLGTLALGLTSLFWLYLIFMGLVGAVMPMFNTPAMVLLQEKVDGDFMGRVFGVMGMIGSCTMPLGMLLFGPISDFFPIEWLLVITGVLIFALSFFLLGSKELMEAGKTMPKTANQPE